MTCSQPNTQFKSQLVPAELADIQTIYNWPKTKLCIFQSSTHGQTKAPPHAIRLHTHIFRRALAVFSKGPISKCVEPFLIIIHSPKALQTLHGCTDSVVGHIHDSSPKLLQTFSPHIYMCWGNDSYRPHLLMTSWGLTLRRPHWSLIMTLIITTTQRKVIGRLDCNNTISHFLRFA